jgi:LCP family protein required for cell wall assembly
VAHHSVAPRLQDLLPRVRRTSGVTPRIVRRKHARGADDDEKVSTPVGDQPTWDGAGSSRDPRGTPRRTRHGQDADRAAAEPVTVEQVLARQGSSVGRRRAARRAEEPDAYRRPPQEPAAYRRPPLQEAPPARRAGMPPVPAGNGSVRQVSRPPVPARTPAAVPPVDRPPVPTSWEPDSRPSRRSGPIPPLPGRVPPPPPRTGDGEPRRRGPRPQRAPLSPGRRRLVRAAVALAAVLGVVLLYGLGLYFYVDQKIDRVDALATDGPEVLAPALQAGAVNYLVVGSGVPGQKGPASVATLLASVAPDGDQAVLVSFPPTALIDTPACRTPDGSVRNPATEAFATSLLDGGPSCMVRAVQQLSGLRVDHYLGMDLARLPGMIDALGGVPVCVVPTAATEAAAEPLPAGLTQLSGDDATGYLRPGATGSDVTGAAVAQRAQRLLTSTLRAAMSTGTLADPITLTRFLNRSADALTVDHQTTLGDLRVLAGSLGSLSGDAVQRVELPVAKVGYVPAGTDEAYVLIDRAATRSLFDAVIEGSGVPKELLAPEQPAASADGGDAAPPAPAPEAAATPAAAQGPTVPPASVGVDVLNGTGTTGLGATVADQLRGQGFVVGTVGNETGTVNQTVVRYGPGAAEQAKTVAAAVPGAVLQASDAIGNAVQLVIGPGFSKVVPVTIAPPPAAKAAAPAPTPAPSAAPAPPATC